MLDGMKFDNNSHESSGNSKELLELQGEINNKEKPSEEEVFKKNLKDGYYLFIDKLSDEEKESFSLN